MYLHPTGGVDLVAGFGKRKDWGRKQQGNDRGQEEKGRGGRGREGGKVKSYGLDNAQLSLVFTVEEVVQYRIF